jgi:hypothetical protein
MSDIAYLLKARDYSKLVPKHGIDHNGKPYTVWIDPEKDRDQAPDLKGQQSMFDTGGEQAHPGKHRGYQDTVRDKYDEHVVKPLIDRISEIEPELSKRIQWKYQNYVWDQETKEIDLEIDYETAKYLKLRKDAPDWAEGHRKEYDEVTTAAKRMVNNRKKHMAAKMVPLKKGAELQLTGGRRGVLDGFNQNGFPVVRMKDGKPVEIFFEEIRFPREATN